MCTYGAVSSVPAALTEVCGRVQDGKLVIPSSLPCRGQASLSQGIHLRIMHVRQMGYKHSTSRCLESSRDCFPASNIKNAASVGTILLWTALGSRRKWGVTSRGRESERPSSSLPDGLWYHLGRHMQGLLRAGPRRARSSKPWAVSALASLLTPRLPFPLFL